MKDILSERLLLLATTQEFMTTITDKMEQWSTSQLNTEKSAFDSMNMSDRVLNMSRDGKRLVELLRECCKECKVTSDSTTDEYLNMTLLLDDMKNLFQLITEASAEVNDISHRIEGEVAFQKEIGEGIKNNLILVGESIDSTIACAEFIMAGL